MKTVGKIVLIITALTVVGCCGLFGAGYILLRNLGAHYEIKDGTAYWVGDLNHDWRQSRFEIKDADVDSFRNFPWGTSQWARDKNHVYFKGRVLRSADPENFQITDRTNHLSRSGDNEYDGWRKTKNNAEQFVSYGFYSTDQNGVYWFDRQIPAADPETFELFPMPSTEYKNDGAWAMDGNTMYCNGRKLVGSDPESFRLLGQNYGIDKFRVYFKSNPLPHANPKTFVVTYHDTKYVIGYDGKYIWTFGDRVIASDDQIKLIRDENKNWLP